MHLTWMIVVALGLLQSGPVFEAASVKRSTSNGNAKTIRLEPGILVIQGMSLKDLVLRAYGRGRALQLSRSDVVSGGPKWCDSELFDIEAKPGGNPSMAADEVSERLRALRGALSSGDSSRVETRFGVFAGVGEEWSADEGAG
jgi:hypothetical protein